MDTTSTYHTTEKKVSDLTRTGPLICVELKAWVAVTSESTLSVDTTLLAVVSPQVALIVLHARPSVTGQREATVTTTTKRSGCIGTYLATVISVSCTLINVHTGPPITGEGVATVTATLK